MPSMKLFKDLEAKQPIVIKMIQQMIQHNRTTHAYLLHGDPGTGKKEIARILAMRLFCRETETTEPCLTCVNCKRVSSGNHPDLHWIKPDGASIKKEQIQDLQREFTYSGLESNRKVYVIEEAALMTTNAQNRLLKFLEEPSQETTAILMTENPQALLDTIRSRCQSLALRPLVASDLEAALVESGISINRARLFQAIKPHFEEAKALDQDEWFAESRKLMVQLISMLQNHADDALFFVEKQWMSHFSDREQLKLGLDLLLIWFKDLIYIHVGKKDQLVMLDYVEKLESMMLGYTRAQLIQIIEAIVMAKRQLDQNMHPTLVMEQLTLQMQR